MHDFKHLTKVVMILIPSLFSSLNLVPPTIKSSGAAERTVVKYKAVSLQCIANGVPQPSLTWLKDDQPVNTAQGNLQVSARLQAYLRQLPAASTSFLPGCRSPC